MPCPWGGSFFYVFVATGKSSCWGINKVLLSNRKNWLSRFKKKQLFLHHPLLLKLFGYIENHSRWQGSRQSQQDIVVPSTRTGLKSSLSVHQHNSNTCRSWENLRTNPNPFCHSVNPSVPIKTLMFRVPLPGHLLLIQKFCKEIHQETLALPQSTSNRYDNDSLEPWGFERRINFGQFLFLYFQFFVADSHHAAGMLLATYTYRRDALGGAPSEPTLFQCGVGCEQRKATAPPEQLRWASWSQRSWRSWAIFRRKMPGSKIMDRHRCSGWEHQLVGFDWLLAKSQN